jgi:hypothetical protein
MVLQRRRWWTNCADGGEPDAERKSTAVVLRSPAERTVQLARAASDGDRVTSATQAVGIVDDLAARMAQYLASNSLLDTNVHVAFS